MEIVIVLLRGINVGGQKKLRMADLLESLSTRGFTEVKSYIQSGNLILSSDKSLKEVTEIVRNCIYEDFGFDVPTLALKQHTISTMLQQVPFENAEDKNLYFTLLHNKPTMKLAEGFNSLYFENEDFILTENCVYLNCKKGAGKAKLNNNLIEKKLKVTATTRNLNTMRKMLEMASLI